MTIKLSDIQLVLLAGATQRPSGSLLPVPDSIADQTVRTRKAIASLLKRGFVEEVEVRDAAQTWREDSERHLGVAVTATGRNAIGSGDEVIGETAANPATSLNDAPVKAATKAAQVLGMLQRDEGATLDELIALTGWLPHTTRAALTGLRKKGHAIDRGTRGDVTCYSVKTAA